MSRATGERTLEIGGRQVKLRFSIMALVELEQRWECKGIAEVINRASNPGATDLVDLFYAMTRSHHANHGDGMPREVCLELLDEAGLGGLTESILGALGDAADEQAQDGDPGEGKGTAAT